MSGQKEFKILKQSTNYSCLAACLLSVLRHKYNITVTKSGEIELLFKGLTFSRSDFSLGHLVHVCEKFNKKVQFFVDSSYYLDYLKSIRLPKSLSLIKSKIDLKLIEKTINHLPIVYVDGFYFMKRREEKTHFPHFIVISDISRKRVTVHDPFYGEKRQIGKKRLMKAIGSLKNRLWIAPKLILIM
jgi:predicted double-glycine peptidase